MYPGVAASEAGLLRFARKDSDAFGESPLPSGDLTNLICLQLKGGHPWAGDSYGKSRGLVVGWRAKPRQP